MRDAGSGFDCHVARESGDLALARWLRNHFGLGMFAANVAGGIDLFILVNWVLPIPDAPGGEDAFALNAVAFAIFVAVTFPLGGWLTMRNVGPVLRWLEAERPPTDAEREVALRLPMRQTAGHAAMWLLAVVVFTLINLSLSAEIARYTAVTIVMGAITTCALTYLLAERLLRPVTARALAGARTQTPVGPGVAGRLVLAWLMATAVPLVGVGLVGIDVLTRDIPADEVGWSILVLTGVALSTGLLATFIAAKSIAEPVSAVRRALAGVEEGDLDIEVRVDDSSEVGLLQSGFNRMAAGLRERERMRDLFGRHVGEDVARAALDGDGELGGEVREVAVLFIDLVGSTSLAAGRPPDEVVALLNRFFGTVVEVVAAHDGWVNKFEGDAALCVFGAPAALDDHAGAALRAARDLRGRLAEDVPELRAGIGVSAGPAVAGNVGAEQRFEYTVIGDPVNEAARLCENAKATPGHVLASEAVLSRAGGDEAARWHLGEEVVLRGREAPTRTAQPYAA